jgi:hypothetical protein
VIYLLLIISYKNWQQQEEEKAAHDWERKMSFVLASHEFGLLFEALAEGLKSRYADLCSACFVSATWLMHMLNVLPDTGIRGAARACLLKRYISMFKSAKDIEDKALSLLALYSFIHDPGMYLRVVLSTFMWSPYYMNIAFFDLTMIKDVNILEMWISEGLRDLTFSMKDIMKGLRELKKSSPLAFEMLKVFSEGHDSSSVSFSWFLYFSFKEEGFP